MGIERRNGWRCDVCDTQREEKIDRNWDVSRIAFTAAEEDSWGFEKLRGKWVALCPNHSSRNN